MWLRRTHVFARKKMLFIFTSCFKVRNNFSCIFPLFWQIFSECITPIVLSKDVLFIRLNCDHIRRRCVWFLKRTSTTSHRSSALSGHTKIGQPKLRDWLGYPRPYLSPVWKCPVFSSTHQINVLKYTTLSWSKPKFQLCNEAFKGFNHGKVQSYLCFFSKKRSKRRKLRMDG